MACRLDTVPVVVKEFATEDEAFDYAVHNQRDRRNLTDADITRLVALVDERRKATRDDDSGKFTTAQACAPVKRTSEQTAQTIGISPRKVEQTRTILDHAPEEIKQAVQSGEMSINRAYEETQQARREEQVFLSPPPQKKQASLPTFNQTNDNIEWAKWTWNPVTG